MLEDNSRAKTHQVDASDSADDDPMQETSTQLYDAIFEGQVHFDSGIRESIAIAMTPLLGGDASQTTSVMDNFMVEVFGFPVPALLDDPEGSNNVTGGRRSLLAMPMVEGSLHSDDKDNEGRTRSSSRRRLVYYSDAYPVVITDAIDDPFCPSSVGNIDQVRCAIIVSDVCLVLEEGDDPDFIRVALTDGLEDAVKTGAFFEAVPPEHIPT